MPVRHTYFNASDNLGQYAADQCKRQAMMVFEVYADDRFCDEPLYVFDAEADSYGLDPWRIVTLDKYMPGHAPVFTKPFLLESAAGTRAKAVAPVFVVFVAKKTLTRLKIEIPESVMDEFHRTRDFGKAMKGRQING